MPAEKHAYEGACHCGAVGYSYRTALFPENWSLRACQCGFCRKHAALSTSDPEAELEFRDRVRGTLHHYRFGQMTADFLVCRKCGVYLGATIATPEGRYGIINVNALRPLPSDLPPAVPADYEGESAEQRIARRVQKWTPVGGDV